jgi:hypothetical protein
MKNRPTGWKSKKLNKTIKLGASTLLRLPDVYGRGFTSKMKVMERLFELGLLYELAPRGVKRKNYMYWLFYFL